MFFHPDLGIGGAERLVVDAAVSLQELGHKVTIFTSHCDKTHCFEEVRDGTLDVRVRGNTIVPHSILGRFTILCAILRQFLLILKISYFSFELLELDPEILFVDQLSACIPILRKRAPGARILFYCHFPDKLLAQRSNWIKSFYRWPFDWLESFSTGASDVIVVNSNYTKSVFAQAFPRLSYRSPRVVHPCVDLDAQTKDLDEKQNGADRAWTTKKTLLSINRFERKKNVGLSIRAYAGLSKEEKDKSLLIIAGGYDPRMSENVSYHKSLQKLATSLDLTHATFDNAITAMSQSFDTNLIFLLSVSTALKSTLLESCTLLIYTPAFEHFGIVPLEAMLAKKPVLAANTGGPKETVVDEETGWLRDPEKIEQWTEIMSMTLANDGKGELLEMGEKGRRRAIENFSKRSMAQKINDIMEKMLNAKTRPVMMEDREVLIVIGIVLSFGFVGICFGAYGLALWMAYQQRLKVDAWETYRMKQEL